jgi:hypothetical protein
MSDLTGHHILALDDSPQSRQAVADALRIAGCPVDVSGSDWYKSGTFSIVDPPAGSGQMDRKKRDSAKLQLLKTQIRGFSELHDAANIVTSIHSFFSSEPEYLNETNAKFLEKYPLNFKEKLSFDAAEPMKKWSIKELLEDVDTLNIG